MPGPTAIVRRPYLLVHDDTAGFDIPLVLSAHVSHGYDLRIAEATIHVPTIPEGTHYYDQITVTMGATPETAQVRFVGYLIEYYRTLYPREVSLICRGRLVLANQIDNPAAGGTDLVGGSGENDATIVAAVLNTCGLSGGLVDLDGTSKTLGAVARDAYRWAEGESALSYVERLDQVCLGFRTFDSPSGVVRRRAVSTVLAGHDVQTITVLAAGGQFTITVPWNSTTTSVTVDWNILPASLQTALQALSNVGAGNLLVTGPGGSSSSITGSLPLYTSTYVLTTAGAYATQLMPDLEVSDDSLSGDGHGVSIVHTQDGYGPVATFTEGVDILSGISATTILPARNRVVVTGYTPTAGTFAPKTFTAEADNESIPDPPGHLTYQLPSKLIEKTLEADSGDGLSCEEVAQWYLAEYKHQQAKFDGVTPRDDLLSPGDLIAIVAPSRLGMETKIFVQRVEASVDGSGFSQSLSGLTGPEEG